MEFFQAVEVSAVEVHDYLICCFVATVLSLLHSTVPRSEINYQDFISTEERGRQSHEKKKPQEKE